MATQSDTSEDEATDATDPADDDGDPGASSLFARVFDRAASAMAILARGGRILEVNQAFADLFRDPGPVEAVDRIEGRFSPLVAEPVEAETLDIHLSTGHDLADAVVQMRRADGSTFWSSVSVADLADDANDAGMRLVTLQDTAVSAAADEANRAADQSYRAIFENASEGLYRMLPDGSYQRANRALCLLHGVASEDELFARAPEGLWSAFVDADRCAEFERSLRTHGRVLSCEAELRRHGGGERFWAALSGHAVRDGIGRLVAFEGSIRDVTQRVRAEARLRAVAEAAEAANRAKTRFLATLTHELRTPLSAIIGFSEMLDGQIFGPVGHPKYVGYVRDILASGQHLLRLIDDLLDLSRYENRRIELLDDTVDLAALVEEVARMVELRARRGNILLTRTLAPDLPLVAADWGRLRQVLLNLVTNALKFTPAAGRVEIQAFINDHGDPALRVVDTGCGIAPEDRDRVFDPFVRVGLGRDTEGVGLGLSIVRMLVELHGGQVAILDTPGGGTTFEVVLPRGRIFLKNPAEQPSLFTR
jgi:PAS domain S-box-containing protein